MTKSRFYIQTAVSLCFLTSISSSTYGVDPLRNFMTQAIDSIENGNDESFKASINAIEETCFDRTTQAMIEYSDVEDDSNIGSAPKLTLLQRVMKWHNLMSILSTDLSGLNVLMAPFLTRRVDLNASLLKLQKGGKSHQFQADQDKITHDISDIDETIADLLGGVWARYEVPNAPDPLLPNTLLYEDDGESPVDLSPAEPKTQGGLLGTMMGMTTRVAASLLRKTDRYVRGVTKDEQYEEYASSPIASAFLPEDAKKPRRPKKAEAPTQKSDSDDDEEVWDGEQTQGNIPSSPISTPKPPSPASGKLSYSSSSPSGNEPAVPTRRVSAASRGQEALPTLESPDAAESQQPFHEASEFENTAPASGGSPTLSHPGASEDLMVFEASAAAAQTPVPSALDTQIAQVREQLKAAHETLSSSSQGAKSKQKKAHQKVVDDLQAQLAALLKQKEGEMKPAKRDQ